MITNHDRSGWFGASDVQRIVAKNRYTKTWQEWWLEKLGLRQNNFSTKAMRAGTAWEHKILDAVDPSIRKDHQILIEKYQLRVNYDGDNNNEIFEVKTYKHEKGFKSNKPKWVNGTADPYWRQAQVEMFAWKLKRKTIPKLHIVAYGLIPEEYDNFFLPVDDKRITFYKIEYDKAWINEQFLPNLKELCRALRKGRFPG